MKVIATLAVALGMAASVFAEYNVRQPSDDIRPDWKGAAPGRWTLDVKAAQAQAKAAGKCMVLLNTGSWWCPFCETLEDKVLRSQAWKDYVAEKGLYLSMLDFPYRGAVKPEEQSKSYHPEFGNGWGFKCWLMNPEYLAANGLTEQQGLEAIVAEYEMQKALGENTTGALTTIINCLTHESFTYRKVGYPTIIVYGADGRELGRTGFPWSRAEDVTDSEAQETVIQAIELLISGRCTVCRDPEGGVPPVDAAQKYSGSVKSAEGLVGTIDMKVGKMSTAGNSSVSGSMTLGGKKLTLKSTKVSDFTKSVSFTAKDKGGELQVNVKFAEYGLSGTVVAADGAVYEIAGGRDLFSSKDAVSKVLAATCPEGTWSVVLKPSDKEAPSNFARGYGALAVTIKAKGKATIAGTLSDGTKVNAKSQVIVGDSEMACLPVVVPLNGKKGHLSFTIWFKDGKLLCFEDVSKWVCADKKHPFAATVKPMATMSAGAGSASAEQELTISGFSGKIDSLPVVGDPTVDEVTVSKTKWTGTDATSFKATCNKRTGLLKGSMTFIVKRENGKPKKIGGTFNGVVMGGSAYGSVVVKGVGAWPVKIAVCGGCSD